VKHGVEGIVAECGGACSCATCHVYVDEAFTDRVGGAGDLEDDMLDGAAAERLPNSRLSCQIKMRDELDGLLVRIAPEQL
jgi:2Fe-2S ferredoxin